MDNTSNNDELTDRQAEALLGGRHGEGIPDGYEGVAEVLDGLRDIAAVGGVPITGALAEFVTSANDEALPNAVPADDRVVALTPEPLDPALGATATDRGAHPRRTRRMASALASSTGAKIAMAGVLGVAAITGAHAADLVDVPGLPDQSGTEVLLADSAAAAAQQPDQSGGAEAAVEAEPQSGGTSDGEMAITKNGDEIVLRLGDISFSIAVDPTEEGLGITIDVEGVSPACEAAIESLGSDLSLDGFGALGDDPQALEDLETLGQDIEAACADDFEALPELDDFAFDMGGLGLEGLFGEGDIESFLEQFGQGFDEHGFDGQLPEGFEGLFGDLEGTLGELFGGDFDPSQLEEFFGDLEGSEFFNPEQLEEFFGDLEGSEFFNPEQLEEFFGDFGGQLSPAESEELDA